MSKLLEMLIIFFSLQAQKEELPSLSKALSVSCSKISVKDLSEVLLEKNGKSSHD